jgi:hypothetical protein
MTKTSSWLIVQVHQVAVDSSCHDAMHTIKHAYTQAECYGLVVSTSVSYSGDPWFDLRSDGQLYRS